MVNRRTGSLVAAILTIATVPALAQRLNVSTKEIPRTKDGKRDLSAPAPRRPDGKPDLSGIWQMDPSSGRKYGPNLLADFKPGELPIHPWAETVARERGDRINEYPFTHCLPPSIPIFNVSSAVGYPLKIVQEPDLVVVILYEVMSKFRQIFLDDRALPKDPNPTWMGYSVGRWGGDVGG